MLNAANYGTGIAPDSLASIFGPGLSTKTATATLDAAGQLPTELADTRVEIANVPALLFYVSPTQINLAVPAGVGPGAVVVVVKSTTSNTSKTASAFLSAVAPGVFTFNATGAGPGAILNAVTYAPAPFLVQTPGDGSDTRTRLAVYCTGFRHAGTVTATAQDTAGDRYKVEYAGAAPGFFGLDQLNLLMPPELDGAGTVSLLLSADNTSANPVTFQMNLLPASALQLATLTVSPAFVNAGDSTAQLTVGLNGVARAGGFRVGLRSNVAAAQVPPQVVIPEGKTSAQTAVATVTVPVTTFASITAESGSLTLTAPLEIDLATTLQLARVAISPVSILGGRNLTGTVTLTGNAPAGGVNVVLASDIDSVPPGAVTVPFGKDSADFTLPTLVVNQTQSATLTATVSRNSATAIFTLLPPMQLTLDASVVIGGNSATGRVTLGDAAPITGAAIQLQSSDISVARPPSSVTIASGQTFQAFTVATVPVSASRAANISASYGSFKQSVSLTVNPQVASTLSALTIAPNPVKGGNGAQGTVTLTAPAKVSTVVTLFTQSSAASVPGSVTVAQGQSSATFPITTFRVPVAMTVTITASVPGVSKSATLTVQ